MDRLQQLGPLPGMYMHYCISMLLYIVYSCEVTYVYAYRVSLFYQSTVLFLIHRSVLLWLFVCSYSDCFLTFWCCVFGLCVLCVLTGIIDDYWHCIRSQLFARGYSPSSSAIIFTSDPITNFEAIKEKVMKELGNISLHAYIREAAYGHTITCRLRTFAAAVVCVYHMNMRWTAVTLPWPLLHDCISANTCVFVLCH